MANKEADAPPNIYIYVYVCALILSISYNIQLYEYVRTENGK